MCITEARCYLIIEELDGVELLLGEAVSINLNYEATMMSELLQLQRLWK